MRLSKLSAVAAIAFASLATSVFAAEKGATITGVVNGDNHKPTSKAQVLLLHHLKGESKYDVVDSTTTNADGEFTLAGVDDGTYVIVAKAGRLRDRSEITIHDGRDPQELSFTLQAAKASDKEIAKEEAAEKAAPKKEYVNFVGQVVGHDKDPVVGATVKLMDGDKVVQTVETGPKGRFEFYKVRFGKYIVDVTKGKMHTTDDVTLDETDGTQSIQVHLK